MRQLQYMNLSVPMSSSVPWTLNKTHVKVAFRMCVSAAHNHQISFCWDSCHQNELSSFPTVLSGRLFDRFHCWYHHNQLCVNTGFPGKPGSAGFPSVLFLHLSQKRTFDGQVAQTSLLPSQQCWSTEGHKHRPQWNSHPLISLPHTVNCVRFCFWRCLWLSCLFMKYFGGTAEQIYARFTGKTCLVPRSDQFECRGQRSRSPG